MQNKQKGLTEVIVISASETGSDRLKDIGGRVA